MLVPQIDLTQQAARAASGFAGRAEVACAGRAPSCFSALPVLKHIARMCFCLQVYKPLFLMFLQDGFDFFVD